MSAMGVAQLGAIPGNVSAPISGERRLRKRRGARFPGGSQFFDERMAKFRHGPRDARAVAANRSATTRGADTGRRGKRWL